MNTSRAIRLQGMRVWSECSVSQAAILAPTSRRCATVEVLCRRVGRPLVRSMRCGHTASGSTCVLHVRHTQARHERSTLNDLDAHRSEIVQSWTILPKQKTRSFNLKSIGQITVEIDSMLNDFVCHYRRPLRPTTPCKPSCATRSATRRAGDASVANTSVAETDASDVALHVQSLCQRLWHRVRTIETSTLHEPLRHCLYVRTCICTYFTHVYVRAADRSTVMRTASIRMTN